DMVHGDDLVGSRAKDPSESPRFENEIAYAPAASDVGSSCSSQHKTSLPPALTRGGSSRQRPIFWGHRSRKRHPLGGFFIFGGRPGMPVTRRPLVPGSGERTEPIKACV